MKYRSDFVTNSSSSSFIINAKNTFFNTEDDVYNYMKELFKQWLSYREIVKEKFGENVVNDFWGGVKFDDHEERGAFSDHIKSLFDIDVYRDYFHPNDLSWIDNCETYADFLNYFEERRIDNEYVELPFEIFDFKECPIETATGIASWYMTCINNCGKQIGREPGYCDEEYCPFGYANRDKCFLFHDKKDEELREYIIEYLGRWCIYTDEGVILPGFIEDRLKINSGYFNLHMG